MLGILAVLIVLSGIDDLVPVLICCWHRYFSKRRQTEPALSAIDTAAPTPPSERRIAIFVPCWKEFAVIGNMVRHNLSAVRYKNFDFFLGVYPNDQATLEVVQELATIFAQVHVAVCPNSGPTSKADCLNSIFARMKLFEVDRGVRFDTIVLHDAEDLIHPEALSLINRERHRYAMVQVPVLPLPTPISEFTHGVYCDEFAEFQWIDMRARQASQSFIPSNGVGTGFAREILDNLAAQRENQVFDPASLTEDYEIGVMIHAAGYSQLFAPLRQSSNGLVATREYFPRRVRSAVRQRTRWITGIALQCWERAGWRGSWRTRYWFWRDRKGLLAHPVSLFTNIVFLYGLSDWLQASVDHRAWAFAIANPVVVKLCWIALLLQCFRTALRMFCVAKIFGVAFSFAVPLRVLHGNVINCLAALRAVWLFTRSRRRGKALVWLKTDHAYPGHHVLESQRSDLADVLVRSGYLAEDQLASVQSRIPADIELADFLLSEGVLSDDVLCQAISLQSGIPSGHIDSRRVKEKIARSLPLHVQQRFGVIPFSVQAGRLLIAGTRAPSARAFEELKEFTPLEIAFQLVTQENYRRLQELL